MAQRFFEFFTKPNFFRTLCEAVADYSCGLIGKTLRKLSKEVQHIVVPTYSIVGLDDKQNFIGKEEVPFADGGEILFVCMYVYGSELIP